jgi:hypothetical protein
MKGDRSAVNLCYPIVCKTTALGFATTAASDMMVNTDTYSQNTDHYLSPFINYLHWESWLHNIGLWL